MHFLRRRKPSEAQRFVDSLMMVVSVIHPFTALPQAVRIYQTHEATGVSLATWLGFMAIGVIFLTYGIMHRIKPLIINQILWFGIDLVIVIGVLMYG